MLNINLFNSFEWITNASFITCIFYDTLLQYKLKLMITSDVRFIISFIKYEII